ncbi:MAG: hypothetical protein K2L89_07085, partial [Muribaculaceae bacterium]|nr:hypothetical protein [Muribaculaceae bacterium]
GLCKRELERLREEKENALYFVDEIMYRYVWRGWPIVSRAKKEIDMVRKGEIKIERFGGKRNIRILDSGIGIYPFFMAKINRDSEIFAYESAKHDYEIASSTAGCPKNLHFIHAVTEDEMNCYDGLPVEFDVTLVNPLSL